MRIVVLGRRGQLGRELQRELASLGLVIPAGRELADLEDPKQLRRFLQTVAPDIVVNAAAYTNVERAENEPRRARMVNGLAPGIIAEEALRSRSVLIHYSTDYVFDGTKREPYLERDSVAPLNAYGESKLEGEQAIAEVGGAFLILRTSWVFSAYGQNFVRTILRLAQERKELTVVHDQFGVPTSATALAGATRSCIERLLQDARLKGVGLYATARKASGIYNAVCGGAGTWCDFAEAVVSGARNTALGSNLRVERILPIPSDQFPTKARRPAYSVLARQKLKNTFAVELPDWRTCLQSSLEQLASC